MLASASAVEGGEGERVSARQNANAMLRTCAERHAGPQAATSARSRGARCTRREEEVASRVRQRCRRTR